MKENINELRGRKLKDQFEIFFNFLTGFPNSKFYEEKDRELFDPSKNFTDNLSKFKSEV